MDLYKDAWPSPHRNYSLLVALISVDRCNEKHIINTEAEVSSCGSKHLGHSKMYILLDNQHCLIPQSCHSQMEATESLKTL